MEIRLSAKKQGLVAIAGHVGCGHSHSLNNQVQDDSCGLSIVLSLFKKATNLSLKIKNIEFSGNNVKVTLENGGIGEGTARRGITPQEKKLAYSLIGKEAVNTHTLVLEAFGRIYGQGILETPVAVQTAIANAALNGFYLNYPEQFLRAKESVRGNCGEVVGTVLEIDGKAVSVLGTVNATIGGIGPNEDQEGNSIVGAKGEIIKTLGMDKLPTLIIEAMIYSGFSKGLTENTYFVRGDKEDDNIVVVESIVKAAEKCGIPIKYHESGMKRTKEALRNNTKSVAEKIITLGEKLKIAETSEEKVNIIAELAVAVSQDCGGISFMSNELHEEIGGAGMLKNIGAVINLVSTDEYFKENPIPYLTDEELERYLKLVLESVNQIFNRLDEANKIINL